MHADPLEALRAADPARLLAPLDDAELAERRRAIATAPVGTAAARRRMPRRRALVLAAAAVLALAGTAVASGVRPWQRDVARQAGPATAEGVFQREYAAAQQALALPPGATWPARDAPADSIIPTGRGGMGESMAVLLALNAWQCYVVDAHDRGDAAALASGVRALDDLIANHIVDVPEGTPEDGAAPSDLPGPIAQFAAGDQPTQALFGGWVRDAERGDVTHLREACAANR